MKRRKISEAKDSSTSEVVAKGFTIIFVDKSKILIGDDHPLYKNISSLIEKGSTDAVRVFKDVNTLFFKTVPFSVFELYLKIMDQKYGDLNRNITAKDIHLLLNFSSIISVNIKPLLFRIFKIIHNHQNFGIIEEIVQNETLYNFLKQHAEQNNHLGFLISKVLYPKVYSKRTYDYDLVKNIPSIRRYTASDEVEPSQIPIVGRGAFGKVWKSKRIGWAPKYVSPPAEDKRLIALKRIERSPSGTQKEKDFNDQLFLNEVNILTKLCGHPHIIKLLDEGVGRTNKYFYLMFNYRETDFHNYLKENRDIHPSLMKNFIYQILLGLEWTHANNIIHSDLKPGNILMENNTLEISDFGSAREIEPKEQGELQQNNIIRGRMVTWTHRAPELYQLSGNQFQGERFSSAIDVWSAGVILLEMLMGYNPFVPSKEMERDYETLKNRPMKHKSGSGDPIDLEILSALGVMPLILKGNIADNLRRLFTGDLPQAFRTPLFKGKTQTFHAHRNRLSSELINDQELFFLLEKMLNPNPNQRISASQALLLPYFNDVQYSLLDFNDRDCYNRKGVLESKSEQQKLNKKEQAISHYIDSFTSGTHFSDCWEPIKKFNNFIKAILISENIKKRDIVLDIGAGKGQDVEKYKHAEVKELVLLDANPKQLEQASQRCEKYSGKFDFSTVYVKDAFNRGLVQKAMSRCQVEWINKFDIVSSNFAFHFAFFELEDTKQAFEIVSQSLKPNGIFIGTIPNGLVMEEMLNSSNLRKDWSGGQISITIDNTDSTYIMNICGTDSPSEPIVLPNTLIYHAKKAGLELIKIQTFSDYFNENIEKYQQLAKLKAYNGMFTNSGQLHPQVETISNLYFIFIFKKV